MSNPEAKSAVQPANEDGVASARAAGSAPSQQSVEAAWRIWKAEVTTHHAPIQSVTQMAEIIEGIFRPKEHLCWAHQDFLGNCMVCGKAVPNIPNQRTSKP